MNESKVVSVQRWLPAVGLDRRDDLDYSFGMMVKHPGGNQGISYVTHADYKALEERHASEVAENANLTRMYEDMVAGYELLKARVAELVEASSDMADLAEQIKRTGGVSTARFNDRSIHLKSAIKDIS